MFDQSIHSSSVMIHFSILPDPRKPRNQLYTVYDLISTTILGTLCGADDYYSISLWAKTNNASDDLGPIKGYFSYLADPLF